MKGESCVICEGVNWKKLHNFDKGRRLLKCLDCGLVKVSGPKKLRYQRYHRDTDYLKFEKHFKNIFLKRFNIVSRFRKKPGRVLEIGASAGLLLDIFKDGKWETWGVEPSMNSKHASQKGHRIRRSVFEKAILPKEYFDLVILNHTLEHLENPLRVLSKIKSHLKKGGAVFIDVPNFGGLSSLILGKRWPLLLPNEHLWQFTPGTLKKLLKKAGFKVVYLRSRSGVFEFGSPIPGLALELKERKKAFLKDFLGTPFAFLATGLNLGSSFSIIGVL